MPQATLGFRWAARMIPAGRIGGDFYDFFLSSDGAVLALLGDVSGKGIPAALILSSLKTLFRALVREIADPAAIAERISAALYGGRPLGLFPGTEYAAAQVELSPGDIGVLVTDGITEALEDGPMTLSQALTPAGRSLEMPPSPAEICDELLRTAAAGPGPAGAPDWQDDRTVFVFALEPAVQQAGAV